MSAFEPMDGNGSGGSGMSLRQFAAHCEARLKQGASKEELFRQMVEAGCPPAEAARMIDDALAKLNSAAGKLLGFGILLLVLGVLTTIATYRTAYEAGGGTYLLWYGAVISGAVCVVMGIRAMVKLRGPRR